jgi:serine/threonine protein kinase
MPRAEGTLTMPALGSPIDQDAERTALLELGLEPPPRFGRFELLGKLRGRGATAVYEARDPAGTLVALKRLEGQRSTLEVERFMSEAQLTRALHDNPNIIPVGEAGEVDGHPYYTMPFMEGGTLVEWYHRQAPIPEALADVMAQIARAVHHAHQPEGGVVLHRDLKPANILMDVAGKPYVADFGVAKQLNHRGTATGNAIVGTLDYMAPEQALGESDKLTPAADIYSLGVVLYELLTSDVPVRGATVGQFLQRLWSAEPIIPPRKLTPGVHRGLENICLKCLENDPRLRYGSAEELARDFDRVHRRQPPKARPPSRPLRVARWIRRHPRTAYAASATMAVAAVTAFALSMSWRAQQLEQDRILDSNAFLASGQAGAALFQLREYADHVVETSHLRLVREILEGGKVHIPAPELKDLVGGFDSLVVMTTKARILAQWPTGAPFAYQRSYEFRDYFRGAQQLAGNRTAGAYVAPAFRSESHGTLDFALSTPVLDDDGGEIGIVVGTLNAKAAFGAVRMEDPAQSGHTGRIVTALIGPRGRDRDQGPNAPAPSDFTFVVHPGMDRGVEFPMRTPTPETLRRHFGLSAPPGWQLSPRYPPALQLTNYHDPVPGFEGEWLAAFAPVGNTGFLILVETRKPPGR